MSEYIELKTLAPKKWVGDFGGEPPLLDSSDDVHIGDIALDEGVTPTVLWNCLNNTVDAPEWVRAKNVKGNCDILQRFNFEKTSSYARPTRNTDGRIIAWDVWEDDTEAVLLFQQIRTICAEETDMAYGRLVSKVTKDILRNQQITELRTYERITIKGKQVVVLESKTQILQDIT